MQRPPPDDSSLLFTCMFVMMVFVSLLYVIVTLADKLHR